jgi:hypothetical protein
LIEQRDQFPRWAQPFLGRWWRSITLEAWHEALVEAGLLKPKPIEFISDAAIATLRIKHG